MTHGSWKRQYRSAALLLALAILTAALAGCAAEAQDLTGPGATTAQTTTAQATTAQPQLPPAGDLQRLSANVAPRPVDASDALTPQALAAAGDFAAALLRSGLAKEGENTLVSPLSVLLALGMTANGAEGDTLAAFESVLGGGKGSLEDLNLLCKNLSDRLRDVSGSTKLHIANGIWYEESFQPEAAFLQANADFFGAEARRAPFSQDTVKEIKGWVSDNTEGMIPGIIESLNPQDVMVLVNTLYMKNTWQRQFDPNLTAEGEFTLADGGKVKADFMNGGAETLLSYNGAEGVLLPYDDGKTAFLAVLPPEGNTAREYAASLDGAALQGLMNSVQTARVKLCLPKFNAAYDVTLNSALKDMGLGVAFDPETADFSRMGQSALGSVYIGLVIHKTRIEVAEKGTEAAAATGVVMTATSAPVEPPKTLRFDRPFLYGIVDLESGLPLFLGVLETPAGE